MSVVEEADHLGQQVGAAVGTHLEAAEELVTLAEGEGATLVSPRALEEVLWLAKLEIRRGCSW